MKKIILLTMMLFVISFAQSATLIDSEDFESYTTATLISGSGGKWNCSIGGAYPSCVTTNGVAADSGFEIEGTTDKYLRLYVMNDSDMVTNCHEIAMDWNFTDYIGEADIDHSIRFELNMLDDDYGSWLGFNRYIFWKFNENVNDPDQMVTWFGGDTGTNDTKSRNLRLLWDNVNLAEGGPCYPGANTWHDYVMYYETNGTHITNKSLYKDGTICAYNDTVSLDNNDFPLTYFRFELECGADVGIDDIEVYSGLASLFDSASDTNCTTWELPYYLKEDFNGELGYCGWATTEDVFYNGTLVRTQAQEYYSINKEMDIVEDSETRFVTIDFDLKPNDIPFDGGLAITLRDEAEQRIVAMLFDSDGIYVEDDGIFLYAYNISAGSSQLLNFNIHLDFVNDDYDVWYNGSIINQSVGFPSSLLNAENINRISITSSQAGYTLDNLAIYATDQNNEIIVVDKDIVAEPNASLSMCGHFFNDADQISCTVDSDCPTDSCLANGKCNRFDMTYCDDIGRTRGNMCYISAVADCSLSSLSDIILDNFLLFLVFIVVLILIGYLVYMGRGR